MAAELQPSRKILQKGISEILKDAKLSELTSRIVRNRLEDLFKVSLRERKKEIDQLLMKMLGAADDADDSANGVNGDAASDHDADAASDHDADAASDDDGDAASDGDIKEEEVEKKPAKKSKTEKKRPRPKASSSRRSKPICDAEVRNSDSDEGADDAELAKEMHGNERGLRTRKKTPVKRPYKTTQKKDPTSGKSPTGFGRHMVLSKDLAEILGADTMSRAEVVKKMWAIIRERNLIDPKDKRYHFCDEQLLKVFGVKRIKTFSMMKYLKHHVKDPSLMIV